MFLLVVSDVVMTINNVYSCYNCIDNNDYDAGPYTVTITAGQNDVSFSVAINDDNIREESEAFNLIIDESSLPSGVSSSDPNAVIVTIMDNDSKCFVNILHTYILSGVC